RRRAPQQSLSRLTAERRSGASLTDPRRAIWCRQSVGDAEALLPVIADEGAGTRVEAAVAVGAVIVPFRAPRLEAAGVFVIHPSWIRAHGLAVGRVVVDRLGPRGEADREGAGREAKHACSHQVAAVGIVAIIVPVPPVAVAGIGGGQGCQRRGGDSSRQDRCLEISVHLRLLRAGPP